MATADAGSRTRQSVVVAYRGVPHARGWETGANLARAFERLGHDVFPYGTYFGSSERVESRPLPERVDLLVYCECSDPDPQYHELRKLDAGVKAYWDFDVGYGHEDDVRRLARKVGFDVAFHANRDYGAFFASVAPKAVFLPYAVAADRFRPLELEPSVDVAIVGGMYPEREAFLDELRGHGVEVEVVSGVFGDAYVEAVNRAKIHLNLNFDTHGGGGLLVARVWETLGCGRLLLAQRKDGIEDLFRDGEHVALFDDAAGCADQIRRYLADDALRERVASAGHAEALAHHTYESRAQQLLATALSLTPRRRRRRRLFA